MAFQVNAADVHVLEETLAKVDSLTSQINSTLQKIFINAEYAEKAITPISGKTRMFNIYAKNLGSSLSVIEEIKDYAKLTGECEAVIKAGPRESGLDTYIDSVEKLRTSLDEMNKSQLRKFYKVVDKTESLIKTGNNQLKDYFQSTLASAYGPIDMNEYMKTSNGPSSGIRMPILSEAHLSIVSELFEYFSSTKQNVDDIYIEMATRHISTSLLPLSKAARTTRTGNTKGQPYEKGSTPMNIYTAALRGLIIARAEDLTLIFAHSNSDKSQIKLTEEVIKAYLNDFISVASSLNDYLTRNMQSESLLVFEIVHSIVLIISTVQVILKTTPTNLSDLMAKVKGTARNVFVEFLRYIDTRVQAVANLPTDNGVSDATTDVLTRLRRLCDYKQSASASIENLTPSSWVPQPRPSWASKLPSINNSIAGADGPWSILSAYFSDAIDALIISLQLRAEALGKKDTQQIGLLLLTNLTFVEATVKTSDMYGILSASGAERIQRLRKYAHNLFLNGWTRISLTIMDATMTSKSGGKQLSSKDRDAIKEKFKTFNAEFDALVSKQKSYNITDPHLRQELVKEISFICPLYHRFYDRHIGGDFSKNVDKYIKYDKQQFDRIINSLG